jgi:hypothetical protein
LYLLLCSPFPRNITYYILRFAHHKKYVRAQISNFNYDIMHKTPQKYLAKNLLRQYRVTKNNNYLNIFTELINDQVKYAAKYGRDIEIFKKYGITLQNVGKYINKHTMNYLQPPKKYIYPNFYMSVWYSKSKYKKLPEWCNIYVIFVIHKCICKRDYELVNFYIQKYSVPSSNHISFNIHKIKKRHIRNRTFVDDILKYLPNLAGSIKYYAFKYNVEYVLELTKTVLDISDKIDYYAHIYDTKKYMLRDWCYEKYNSLNMRFNNSLNL